MRLRSVCLWSCCGLAAWGMLRARPFQEYPGYEYNNFPIPEDYMESTNGLARV